MASFPPTYLDESGVAVVWLVNPSGGLVGGDQLSVEATLHADAHVVITSPSANRVYRSQSEPALQSVRCSVGPGARLEWMPEGTIPFAGSRFSQSIQVDLAPGSTLLLWDAMASGRIAKPERWAFETYDNEIRLSTASGGSVVERFHLTPDTVGTLPRDWDYVASLFVLSDKVEGSRWAELREDLAVRLEGMESDLLAGVSEPSMPGLVVKLMARSAPILAQAQAILWGRTRMALFGLSMPVLRRY
ncbi:MAG: urease accessory protein UreD [Nitrospiraceae bacterium]